MKNIICFFEILWTNILILFGIKKSISPIPKNTPYCYKYDVEKNKNEPLKSGYWINRCKYYRHLNNGKSGCTFVGYMGYDVLLNDQCKICDIKTDN